MKILDFIETILATMGCTQNRQQRNDQRSKSSQRGKEMETKLFQTVQKNMAAMGFIPSQQQNNYWQLSSGQIFGITKCSIDIISIGLYVFRTANRIDEYVESGYSLTVASGFTIVFISIAFKNDKLFNLIEMTTKEEQLRLNYNPAIRAIHERSNRLIEKLSKIIYFAAIKLAVPAFVLPKAIISYFIYFTTDAGSEAFQLPFPACFPFDWKNPIGYLIVIMWVYLGIFIQFWLLACLVPLALGCFLFAFTFIKDWRGDLRTLDEMAKSKQSEANMFKQLTEFVRSHSNAKQLINDFVDIFEITLFADVLSCTIALCVVMMMIKVEIISQVIIDPEILWKSILFGCAVFGLIFFSCEIGQRFTNSFEKITDQFDQLNWYLFPMKVQRLLPAIIINVQEPMVIGCFGVMQGSRDQFKKVVDVAYKSFNLLLNFYN